MKIEIEIPKKLEPYRDDIINYALEAAEIKAQENIAKEILKAEKSKMVAEINSIKIDEKTYKQIKEEKKQLENRLVDDIIEEDNEKINRSSKRNVEKKIKREEIR